MSPEDEHREVDDPAVGRDAAPYPPGHDRADPDDQRRSNGAQSRWAPRRRPERERGEQRTYRVGEPHRGQAVEQFVLEIDVQRHPSEHARQRTGRTSWMELRVLTAWVP